MKVQILVEDVPTAENPDRVHIGLSVDDEAGMDVVNPPTAACRAALDMVSHAIGRATLESAEIEGQRWAPGDQWPVAMRWLPDDLTGNDATRAPGRPPED